MGVIRLHSTFIPRRHRLAFFFHWRTIFDCCDSWSLCLTVMFAPLQSRKHLDRCRCITIVNDRGYFIEPAITPKRAINALRSQAGHLRRYSLRVCADSLNHLDKVKRPSGNKSSAVRFVFAAHRAYDPPVRPMHGRCWHTTTANSVWTPGHSHFTSSTASVFSVKSRKAHREAPDAKIVMTISNGQAWRAWHASASMRFPPPSSCLFFRIPPTYQMPRS